MGGWENGSMLTEGFEKEQVVAEDNECSRIVEKVSSWMRGSLIGAGAFGKVNLALNKENGALFAVKSIECNERTGSELEAMENELHILQYLNSPFVVRCLGSSFSVENGKSMRNVFIEYMSGGSVADLMKKFGGHFDEPLIKNYTRSILQGILYLHSRGVVHCDIKGKNVLVGSSGVKLADFGGARRLDGYDGVIVDSNLLKVKGTPLWMAPEVVRQVEQGPPSDIWSLGCTVVEMATGKAPWSDIANARNPFVALYHIGCTEEVPELPSCLSEQGQDFLRKCFQRDPRVRWTADQLLQHPFITDNFPTIQSKKPPEVPLQSSPTNAFDFSTTTNITLTSSIIDSVPILRSPLFAKRFSQHKQAANFFQTEEVPVNHKESTSNTPSSCSSGTDFWCHSPLSPLLGQWIVVRTPKSTMPATSPASSAIARELAVSVSQTCQDFPLQVEEIPAIASCAPVEVDLWMAEYDDQRRSREIAMDKVSCRGDKQLLCVCSRGMEKRKGDDMVQGEAGEYRSPCSRRVSVRCCSSFTKPGKEKLRNLVNNCDLEQCYCPGGAAAANGTRGKPELKFASLRATLRKLVPAHRKMSLRGRPKPLQRLTVRKQLHEFLCRKMMTLGRSLNSYSFVSAVLPQERVLGRFLGSVVGSYPPSLFSRNKLFLNKTTSPPWRLLYTFSGFIGYHLFFHLSVQSVNYSFTRGRLLYDYIWSCSRLFELYLLFCCGLLVGRFIWGGCTTGARSTCISTAPCEDGSATANCVSRHGVFFPLLRRIRLVHVYVFV